MSLTLDISNFASCPDSKPPKIEVVGIFPPILKK